MYDRAGFQEEAGRTLIYEKGRLETSVARGVGGATTGMDVTWRIEPRGRGARVTIEHDFAAPVAWATFVDRFFTRHIAGRTLAAFRSIAEAVDKSGAAAAANYRT